MYGRKMRKNAGVGKRAETFEIDTITQAGRQAGAESRHLAPRMYSPGRALRTASAAATRACVHRPYPIHRRRYHNGLPAVVRLLKERGRELERLQRHHRVFALCTLLTKEYK